MFALRCLVVVLVLQLCKRADAFVSSSTKKLVPQIQASRTMKMSSNEIDIPAPPQKKWTSQNMYEFPESNANWLSAEFDLDKYKEDCRPIKRTVFNFDDWRFHRSSKRYLNNLATIFDSEITRSLRNEIFAVLALSTTLVTYNQLIGSGFDTALGHIGALSIKPTPFSLCTGALSLLLSFRVNDAYGRWKEARQIWGNTTQRCNDLVRTFLAYVDQGSLSDAEFADLKRELVLRTIAYVRAQKIHFRDGADEQAKFKAEITRLLGAAEAERICAAAHKPLRCVQDLSEVIRTAPLTPMARINVDRNVATFCDTFGASERIFKTPVPLIYTRHTSRFLSIWLLALPLALYNELNGLGDALITIPIAALLAFFLAGIEELGIQIEEPFSILPLEEICDDVERTTLEMLKTDLKC